MIRLADTVAVLCFAVSAGLGVVRLMQHTRGASTVVATVDDGRLTERLQALEQQLAATQAALPSRASVAPEWRVVDERLARLENRLGAVEDRAAVARPRTAPAATSATPARIAPAAPVHVEPAPRPTPPATAAAAIPREPARTEAPPAEPSLGEKLRRDWEAVKSNARRGSEEWRDGWDQLKRLFGY